MQGLSLEGTRPKKAKAVKTVQCCFCKKNIYSSVSVDFLFNNQCCVDCYNEFRRQHPNCFGAGLIKQVKGHDRNKTEKP